MKKELQFRPIELPTKILLSLCFNKGFLGPFGDCVWQHVLKGFRHFTGFCKTYSALPNNRDRIKNKFFSRGVANPGRRRLSNPVNGCRKVKKLAGCQGGPIDSGLRKESINLFSLERYSLTPVDVSYLFRSRANIIHPGRKAGMSFIFL